MTDLIPAQTITAMAEAYERSQHNVKEAFRLIEESESLMDGAFGKARVLPWRRNMGTLDESYKVLKKNAWEHIIKQTGIDAVMTADRRKEFDKDLSMGNAPEPTVDTIMGFLHQMRGDSGKYLKESIGELYSMLRPWNGVYATNDKFEVKDRVILERIIEPQSRYQNTCLRYESEGDVALMDNIFHLLDGQGMPKPPYDLATEIKGAIREGDYNCETAYFDCKWFKKGTLHIRFKRMDLVKEINRVAGGGSLKS
jgi:hypothetical protein